MTSTFKAFILISALFFISCKKSSDGGKAIVRAHIGHHSKPIKGAVVYVKFNTQNAPDNPETDYDMKIMGEDTEDHLHINGLRYGEYFLSALAYDSLVNQPVRGGIPLKIAWSERKKEIEVDIPVSEY